MSEPAPEQLDVIHRMFALLTARLEDAAELATTGQGSGTPASELRNAANGLISAGEGVKTLGEAILQLLGGIDAGA